MMVEEKHYDDDSLIALASEAVALDEHLASCADCSERLETFRLIAEAMAVETTWDTRPLSDTPVPETIANLRSFADRMAMEDAEAAANLPNLLAGQREQWMDNLHLHPEYRTAGVVRKLLESVPSARDMMPRDAVEMTALAIEIADHLDGASPQLRGAAWRERAYSLFYVGDFVAAERATANAEGFFNASLIADYDLARLGIVGALVERGLEEYSRAIARSRASAEIFQIFGDRTRYVSARLAEVHLLFSICRYQEAHDTLMLLRNALLGRDDVPTYARVIGNLGFCCWKLQRPDQALLYFDEAAQLLEASGIYTEAVRSRWNAARVLTDEGRFQDALPRLRGVSGEFERFGMMAPATESSLEIAEILVSNGDFDQAEEICRTAIRRFETSHLAYTAPALTALALMQEAVRNRTATRKFVSHVREYLRRVPDEPALLFAFPAE